jgi:hypothetical protein
MALPQQIAALLDRFFAVHLQREPSGNASLEEVYQLFRHRFVGTLLLGADERLACHRLCQTPLAFASAFRQRFLPHHANAHLFIFSYTLQSFPGIALKHVLLPVHQLLSSHSFATTTSTCHSEALELIPAHRTAPSQCWWHPSRSSGQYGVARLGYDPEEPSL